MTRANARHIERHESPACAQSERAAGIEPAWVGWKPAALPIGQTLERGRAPHRPRSSAVVVDDRASSSQHSMVGALLAGTEQVVGVEPDDSGVAHRRVTATLHLLGGLSRDLGRGSALASSDTSGVPHVGRVGIEPTSWRCKRPLQSQRLLPTPNVVLPPGVEPGPLGFQPSALTACAKEGELPRARSRCSPRAAVFHQVPCQAPHRHRSSVVTDLPRAPCGRTSGVRASAVLAGARFALVIWSETSDLEYENHIVLTITSVAGATVVGHLRQGWSVGGRPRNDERATWSSRAALTQSALTCSGD